MKHPTLSHNIKLMMKHLGFTAQEFADKFEVKKGMIESYMQGRAIPKVDFINKMFRVFGITYEQLMKQKLTESDLKGTGSVKSVTEVKLEEALKRIELLENTIKDKDRIIELMSKSVTKPSRG